MHHTSGEIYVKDEISKSFTLFYFFDDIKKGQYIYIYSIYTVINHVSKSRLKIIHTFDKRWMEKKTIKKIDQSTVMGVPL